MYMNNKLGYLGFLSLLGLLGFTGNIGFFGFFGFIAYFRYFKVIPDELFKENIRRAATPGFFVSITVTALVTVYIALLKNVSAQDVATGLAIGLTINFVLSVFVFTGILLYLEIHESGGEQ